MQIARSLAAATVFASLTAVVGIIATTANSQMKPPFGNEEDVAYAKAVWTAMTDAKLVGGPPSASAMLYHMCACNKSCGTPSPM